MRSLLDKLFVRSNNLDNISLSFKELSSKVPTSKIFEAINSYSLSSEIRYVGGCVRKIINKENIDDIDLATNLEPEKICDALKKNQINYYETGIDHGTITALIDNYKFEITSLREDISTDGRHAQVRYSKDWKKDAARRDFTINSIYSDYDGNLFDPYKGKEDIEKGEINFIGNPDKRIQEDYLRILRYIRFFLNYSKQKHKADIIKSIRRNLNGISKLSKERLIDELRKILSTKVLQSLTKDKFSLEIIEIIFPELKYFSLFSKLNSYTIKILNEVDFIFVIALLIIDETDNTDYFLYKFNISKKNQKRIKNLYDFYNNKKVSKKFSKQNLNKIFYYKGKETLIDILNFKMFKSKKLDNDIIELINLYKKKTIPTMPIKADILIEKYKIPQGKILGDKIKLIEEEWVNNNFQISDQEIEIIANS
tara:strand:- start:15386 stop:16660 length:1275 start_codon:yes stop_codon:yes gene_type:complete